jgi:hypothetical protein
MWELTIGSYEKRQLGIWLQRDWIPGTQVRRHRLAVDLYLVSLLFRLERVPWRVRIKHWRLIRR